jgi:DNA polymerase-3 subunit epsilon
MFRLSKWLFSAPSFPSAPSAINDTDSYAPQIPVPFKSDFIALDVETANQDIASICQIGIAWFRDGVVIKEWRTYINPQENFAVLNSLVHGITKATVKVAPCFSALADKIRRELAGNIVVTHTAFDIDALNAACDKYNVAHFNCTWLDSRDVARNIWNSTRYGLADVCNIINYNFRHHDALEDAKASGQIIVAATTKTGLDISKLDLQTEASLAAKAKEPLYDPPRKKRASLVRNGSNSGRLADEVLVFTGVLSISKDEAADRVAALGCRVMTCVGNKTTVLVTGEPITNEKSQKQRKAESLIAKGQNIRIMPEAEFRQLVNY